MLIHPWDAAVDDDEWQRIARSQGFGHFIASGVGREVPVVVPTQYVLSEDATVMLAHFARPNPVWRALEDSRHALMSIAGDWAYVPSHLKVGPGDDPSLGVPTTYYGAVQLIGVVDILDDSESKLEVLRALLADLEPGGTYADPKVHTDLLNGIRGVRLTITEVKAKFKYGGNVTDSLREVAVAGLAQRNGAGDQAAIKHLTRRTPPQH